SRIARDMHDNIGVQLVGALHSRQPVRKDTLIRETLSDLRDIINNASAPGARADDALADLRAEIADHLTAANMTLDWTATTDRDCVLPPGALHALRSVIREAVGNIMKHAQARDVRICITCAADAIRFSVVDNGQGFAPDTVRRGQGLSNMRARL